MAREVCPRCRELRNMQVTVSRRRVVDCDGRVTHVCVRALHCEQCGTFVRSEDVECPDGRSGSA